MYVYICTVNLSKKYYMYLDIDECLSDNGGCEQNCHNQVGNFYCTCDSGYNLNDNNLDCEGKRV